jgi:hypothetical protein
MGNKHLGLVEGNRRVRLVRVAGWFVSHIEMSKYMYDSDVFVGGEGRCGRGATGWEVPKTGYVFQRV